MLSFFQVISCGCLTSVLLPVLAGLTWLLLDAKGHDESARRARKGAAIAMVTAALPALGVAAIAVAGGGLLAMLFAVAILLGVLWANSEVASAHWRHGANVYLACCFAGIACGMAVKASPTAVLVVGLGLAGWIGIGGAGLGLILAAGATRVDAEERVG